MKIKDFDLERYLARYEFTTSYTLSSSDSESFSISQLLDLEPGARGAFEALSLGYTESLGHPELRTQISRLYETVSADQVLVHSGAEEAIFNFMNGFLSSSDHVIVQWPCYQSLSEIPRALGCAVTLWKTAFEKAWELDLNELQKHIQKTTKLIVINTPHNPTGYHLSKNTYDALISICRRHRITLFVDEVYRFSEHDPSERLPAARLPAATDAYEKAVSLGVLSKSFGLPGLRIGWVATKDQSIYQNMVRFKDYTTICNSAPSEFLATLALSHKEKLLERNHALALKNLKLAEDFFSRFSDDLEWNKPHAGVIAFPRFKKTMKDTSFYDDLIKTKQTLLVSGIPFGFEPRYFRLGFGRKNFPEALKQLESFLNTKRSRH